MIDATLLGRRLRTARERRGLSQEAVAEVLGVPRTAITNMENGNRAVSTLELAKLSDLYGPAPAFFLAAQSIQEEELSIALPRALPEMADAPALASAVRRMVDLYREGAVLRRMLDQAADQALPNYAAPLRSTSDAIRQGEHVGLEERRRLGLGNAPISDVAELIAAQGVWIAAADLPDSLSGLFLNHASIGLAIIVNARHWPVRKRFSYSHEYAHALFDREAIVTTTRRENSSEFIEKRANAFAATFLMPPEGVADQLRQLHKGAPSRHSQIIFDVANNATMEAEIRPPAKSQAITYQDVAVLARHFGVSYESVVWRLKNLGWLNVGETELLIDQREVGNRYVRLLGFTNLLDEPPAVAEAPERELRTQLTRLAVEAYRREEVSRGRLIELGRKLGIAGDQLLELAEAARPN